MSDDTAVSKVSLAIVFLSTKSVFSPMIITSISNTIESGVVAEQDCLTTERLIFNKERQHHPANVYKTSGCFPTFISLSGIYNPSVSRGMSRALHNDFTISKTIGLRHRPATFSRRSSGLGTVGMTLALAFWWGASGVKMRKEVLSGNAQDEPQNSIPNH